MVNTLTRSTSRSRRCQLQQESCAGVHLLRSKRTTAHSPGPPAQKKGKITLTTAENSSGEVQKIDHAPTRLLVDRSTSSTFPADPFLAFRYHSVDNWTLLISTSFVRSSGARASCLETERKSTGVKKKASRDLGYRRGPGVEWRRKASVDRNDCVWCGCVMTRCQVAQGNQNKMAKLPRTSTEQSAQQVHKHTRSLNNCNKCSF